MDEYYAPFFWGVLSHFRLTPGEALFLTLVENLSKRTGWCYASKAFLAKTLNVSEPTIYEYIKKLTEMDPPLLEKREKTKNGVVQLMVSEEWTSFMEERKKSIQEAKEWKKYKNSKIGYKNPPPRVY